MEAIFNVQHAVGIIKRESTGSTGNRNYKYTSLDKVWEAAQGALKDQKLAVTQAPTAGEHGGNYFQTTIYHIESGQSVTQKMQMVIVKDDPQSIGSAITYYRRYMLLSMLGLITVDDSDAVEHKLATAQQKAKLVGAVKEIFPDINTHREIIETIQNIVGKHPSYIREEEADDCLDLIKAFTAKAVKE